MSVYTIKVFLVNSDQEAAKSLIEVLSNVEDIEIVGDSRMSESALAMLPELLPNVVIIDDDLPGGAYSLAEEITQKFVNMAVIILANPPVDQAFRDALQAGARDVIGKPFNPPDLVDAIYGAYEYEKKRRVLLPSKTIEEARKRKAKVITVFSGKGGVGKTTIAVNLAATLAKKYEARTVLWDLDLHHGIVAVATNIVQRRHIADLLNEIQYLDADLLESYLERHESGLMVLPAPFTPEFADFVSAEHVTKILSVARENWDYVIIDCPSFFHEPAVAAMKQSDLIMLVGSLDMGTIKNLKACLMIMDKLNFSRARLRLVVNRVGREFGVFLKDIEATLKMPVFATIPADANSVLTGLNQGVPPVFSHPNSDFGRGIQMLAEKVFDRVEIEEEQKEKKKVSGFGLFNFMK